MALTTYDKILSTVRDNREEISEARYVEDYLGELADSEIPAYTNEIIREWIELPSEFSDRWQELGIASGDTIDRLMAIDLYLYYRDQFEHAWREVELEHDCPTETN
jgi:hypothetical protein